MKLYNCQVRLAGNLNHVVPKYAVTESEILVLRHLHGNDSVVHIKSIGEDKERQDTAEYSRLAGIYGQDKIESLFMVKLDLNPIIEEDAEEEEPVLPASVQAAMGKSQQPAKVV